MGIETKYEYIYYTVLDQDWFDTARRTLQYELTSERLCNAINRKLKHSKDWTLNGLEVDYSQHCDDIDYWIRRNIQHRERPVFVQIENNQSIITSGSGTLFVFYEEDDEEDALHSGDEEGPDNEDYCNVYDGLTGAGGRL